MEQPPDSPELRNKKVLVRFLSNESDGKYYSIYKTLQIPQWNYSFISVEFLFKVAQLIIAIICIGMYSAEGIYTNKNVLTLLQKDILSSIIFPNVVFSSCIIILCIIIISYTLGYPMPDILVRIFNVIAVILYLVTIGVSGVMLSIMKDMNDDIYQTACGLLLAVIILCSLNCFLHAFDIYWSIRRILDNINV